MIFFYDDTKLHGDIARATSTIWSLVRLGWVRSGVYPKKKKVVKQIVLFTDAFLDTLIDGGRERERMN